MRKDFENLLFNEMAINPKIYLITGDLGYGLWDRIRDTYPTRFFNVGSSEMVLMGTGIGLAMDGMIPFVYSITPFAIYRPFEMIRNYVIKENIPVKIIGGGRNRDYGYLGFSHWAEEDLDVLGSFRKLRLFKPPAFEGLLEAFRTAVDKPIPCYINLAK
jgi:transketolase